MILFLQAALIRYPGNNRIDNHLDGDHSGATKRDATIEARFGRPFRAGFTLGDSQG